ncbi:nucleic acid-binding protein [Romboutsia timonensis]|uniref:nucleic acid-binding protein n=1 Tax=Romboutsia timonensis TaxID=1776391 RepID=UPI0039903B34
MRTCKQCDSEMVNGFDIKVDGTSYGIKITKNSTIFSERIEKPKVAICPKCGEVSLYIEKLDKISSR